MKKVLYIGYQSLNLSDSGGALGCIRNHDSLEQIFGKDNVETFVLKGTSKPSFCQKLHNNYVRLFHKMPFPIDDLKDIEFNKYHSIFIDSSRLGSIAKIIRRKDYRGKIVVFFHNFDYKFICDFYSSASSIKKWINVRVSLSNEEDAITYSDINIILNKRDSDEMRLFYNLKNEYRIPVSLHDRYSKNNCCSPYKNTGKPVFLFVGSHFFGNVVGLDWFMREVFPYVNIQFVIVGKDMFKLKSNPLYKNIEIYSDVQDINPYIIHANCMLMPLIGGSGMKIKTCESLMFGKNIIGTNEAFEGYEIDIDKVGKCCNNAESFIKAINNFNMPMFNEYSRKIFLEKYSFSATLQQFKYIMEL
ncbi:glycosyltransferase [uncultured Bacteroides sp.]|uniref:glycosyltransferase n=1 Tax=uncultured Bacteroides sp. TaxID=162156 RepID=UPI002610DD1A|nr:glycosyltransferase [uncultured Bacteroides sp.]